MSKKKKRGSKSKGHDMTVPLSLFRGLLVIGTWIFIGLVALTAWYAIELPALISTPQFEKRASITLKASDGTIIDRMGDIKGINVGVAELPPHLIYAVLATEDRRFYQHFGIDPMGILRAMGANLLAGHTVQGGSTITQQLAKNLFLKPERTLKRKIQEALLALWLENTLTKDEILSAYLNRVYLGSGAYGVDAAAHIYFNKSAPNLTLRESATLAGMLKAPSRYAPDSNPGLSAKRVKIVLGAMAEAGYITKEEAKHESLTMMTPRRKPAEGGGIHYFTDWIASSLNDLIGVTEMDISVDTTLDPATQEEAERVLNKYLREKGEEVHASQGAVIVMARDGAVLAMVGGRDYAASQFNRAAQALRSPGSSFKPIVYLTALQMGWTKDDLLDDSPLTEGKYRPENYNLEYYGPVTMQQALTHSLNAATVRLAKQIGIDSVITTARMLGIRATLERDLSLALGSSGVPMIEMVSAYAVLANGGHSVNPYAVHRIKDSKDQLVYEHTFLHPAQPLFDERAMIQIDEMLQSVVREGTGRRAALPYRTAGKTGTSQDFRDSWFIGYTDCCVAGVWVGNDDNSSMKHVTGGSLPAAIWHDIMINVQERRGYKSWPASDNYDGSSGSSGGDGSQGGAFNSLLHRLLSE